jgi:hypothetical protein
MRLAQHNLSAIGWSFRQLESRPRRFNTNFPSSERLMADRFSLAQVPQDPDGLRWGRFFCAGLKKVSAPETGRGPLGLSNTRTI